MSCYISHVPVLSLILVAAETVVGATTGVLGAPKGYSAAMKSVCEKYGALFILDEVMCGMGSKLFSLGVRMM